MDSSYELHLRIVGGKSAASLCAENFLDHLPTKLLKVRRENNILSANG